MGGLSLFKSAAAHGLPETERVAFKTRLKELRYSLLSAPHSAQNVNFIYPLVDKRRPLPRGSSRKTSRHYETAQRLSGTQNKPPC